MLDARSSAQITPACSKDKDHRSKDVYETRETTKPICINL